MSKKPSDDELRRALKEAFAETGKPKEKAYSIEELAKTFKLHHVRSEKLNKKLIKEFKESNPGEPIPDPFADDFSLPRALESICHAILELKKEKE